MDPLQRAARKHASPMLPPASGVPLLKTTASLGRRLEWRKGRSRPIPQEWTTEGDPAYNQARVHAQLLGDLGIFIQWMEKEDRAHYRGKYYLEGPQAHFTPKPPDTQHGDAGGTRKVARNLMADTEAGLVDYIIWALFDVPEYITEIPTELAQELFLNGRPGLRPLRGREWERRGDNQWSRRN